MCNVVCRFFRGRSWAVFDPYWRVVFELSKISSFFCYCVHFKLVSHRMSIHYSCAMDSKWKRSVHSFYVFQKKVSPIIERISIQSLYAFIHLFTKNSPLNHIKDSIFIMDRCLSVAYHFIKKYNAISERHKESLLGMFISLFWIASLLTFVNTAALPPENVVNNQYYYYMRVVSYSLLPIHYIFSHYHALTKEICNRIASTILHFVTHYPKSSVSFFFTFDRRFHYVNSLLPSYRKWFDWIAPLSF